MTQQTHARARTTLIAILAEHRNTPNEQLADIIISALTGENTLSSPTENPLPSSPPALYKKTPRAATQTEMDVGNPVYYRENRKIRPTSQEILHQTLLDNKKLILDYLECDEDYDLAENFRDIECAMESEHDMARAALNLKNKGWEFNSDLIELCENIEGAQYSVKDRMIREWIAHNNIKPLYKIGDHVLGWSGRYQISAETGNEIVDIYFDQAEYVIQTSGLNLVVKFENISGLAEAETDADAPAL